MIGISPIQLSPPSQDTCLVLQNHEFTLSHELHNASQTNTAEDIFKASGYVLTDEPWRELAFIAARKVFAERTAKLVELEFQLNPETLSDTDQVPDAGKSFPVLGLQVLHVNRERVVRRTGQNKSRLEAIEQAAEQAGYFDRAPYLASRPRIPWSNWEGKFAAFDGQYGWRISRELAEAFIWQFPVKFRADAISLVNEIQVLDKRTAATHLFTALEKFSSSIPADNQLLIAPLSPNSGHEMRIAFEEGYRDTSFLKSRARVFHSIHELLTQAKGHFSIALIDDNIVSGSQAYAQIAAWMGLPREFWPPELKGEENIENEPLNEQQKRTLLGKLVERGNVAICVSFGSEATARIRLSNLVANILQHEPDERERQGSLFRGGAEHLGIVVGDSTTRFVKMTEGFEKFLSSVGASVYAHAKYDRQYDQLKRIEQQTCRTNSLGFGNVRGTTFTFRNVPVSTLTALWCPGVYDGRPWVPLGVRRGYVKKLVLG